MKALKKTSSYKLSYVRIEVHSMQICQTLEFSISNNETKFNQKTKLTIFEQTQVEPKKKRFYRKVWSPTLNKNGQQLHLQLQWKLFTAQEKSMVWQLSRASLSEHQLNRKKKILWNVFKTKKFGIGMNKICTCNYKENCLQHKPNPLWQFSRQNLSEQTKNQKFTFLGYWK